jgi:hypothetical protein
MFSFRGEFDSVGAFFVVTMGVTWLVTLGGGRGANWLWVLGILFYKGVRLERGENWSHKTQVFHFLFSVYFLFAIIQFSKQKSYS